MGDQSSTPPSRPLVELLKESVVVQGVITILLVGVTAYRWAIGQSVPTELLNLDGLIIGFYFGSKIGFYQGVARGYNVNGLVERRQTLPPAQE